jgi:uroporphyrinogen-III synthase
VLVAQPPSDLRAVERAAADLHAYDWVVCASARSVAALAAARPGRWPAGVRTAAVGARTAAALLDCGAWPRPLVGADDGANSLWARLRDADHWTGRRVLVPTTPGGRRVLADRLREAGATVEEVETYRMAPRLLADIAEDWTAGRPDAAVIASPRVAETLIQAVGVAALTRLAGIVAIGSTTADAVRRSGVVCAVSDTADFGDAARALARLRGVEAPR